MLKLELSNYLYDSNADLGMPDWRMMERKVPTRSSEWFGIGTVTVDSSVFFCITI